jgi:hypothetical protein
LSGGRKWGDAFSKYIRSFDTSWVAHYVTGISGTRPHLSADACIIDVMGGLWRCSSRTTLRHWGFEMAQMEG